MPPGRRPITTRRVADEKAHEVWLFVRNQVKLGHQAYIVYPVIEGTNADQPELDFSHDEMVLEAEASTSGPAVFAGKITATKAPAKSKKSAAANLFPSTISPRAPLKSAVEMYEQLRTGPLEGLRVGLLHGRLDADRKEIIMRRFQRGEIDVLVSTTVIEVGVDVPNASVMIVEHADRFGLAQLHQLRGRVGRGTAESTCILMTGPNITPQAEERLDAMARTQNGFELAELDLRMRGPGEFFGTRQAGLPEFRVADLLRDRKLLELAKIEAEKFALAPEEGVSDTERKRVWERLKQAWQRKYGLVEAG
jgi:ATP-dependent DNA helicase RecG